MGHIVCQVKPADICLGKTVLHGGRKRTGPAADIQHPTGLAGDVVGHQLFQVLYDALLYNGVLIVFIGMAVKTGTDTPFIFN